MIARLGNVIYWLGCTLACICAALLYWNPIAALFSVCLLWATGWAIRYILTGITSITPIELLVLTISCFIRWVFVKISRLVNNHYIALRNEWAETDFKSMPSRLVKAWPLFAGYIIFAAPIYIIVFIHR